MTFTRIVVVCFSDLALARPSHHFAREKGDIGVPEFVGGTAQGGQPRTVGHGPLARIGVALQPGESEGCGWRAVASALGGSTDSDLELVPVSAEMATHRDGVPPLSPGGGVEGDWISAGHAAALVLARIA